MWSLLARLAAVTDANHSSLPTGWPGADMTASRMSLWSPIASSVSSSVVPVRRALIPTRSSAG